MRFARSLVKETDTILSWIAVNAVNKLDPSIQLDYTAFKPYGDPKVQLKDIWGIYAQKYWQAV
jgi:hypothetical protein